jgi:hypothetical protein
VNLFPTLAHSTPSLATLDGPFVSKSTYKKIKIQIKEIYNVGIATSGASFR